jgi:hypothetical protein
MTDTRPPLPGFLIDDPPASDRSLIHDPELISDLARFSEAQPLCTESAIRKKWRLSEATWELLGSSDELVRAVEEEKTRRIRSGATKREAAQLHIIRGPAVLATIMDDPRQSARHRVDSIKTLNAIADPGPEAAAEQQRIFIRIDMGADLRAKGQEPNPKDVVTIEAAVQPKPNSIDSWDTPKQLELNQQEAIPPKRGPGRPPGSKNKPKLNQQEPLPGFAV